MSQNQNQGNVQGDDKKKEKSFMTWHGIVCDGSEKRRVRSWRCTISRGLGAAGGHAILVLNQKKVPQGP